MVAVTSPPRAMSCEESRRAQPIGEDGIGDGWRLSPGPRTRQLGGDTRLQTIMLPLVENFSDGQERTMRELTDVLADRFGLTEPERLEVFSATGSPRPGRT
jgi:hypothetical protein